MCVQWVGVALNNVKVEWFNWFAVVRAEAVKLVKNGNFSYLAEGCGVGFANVHLDELLSRDGLVPASPVNLDHL